MKNIIYLAFVFMFSFAATFSENEPNETSSGQAFQSNQLSNNQFLKAIGKEVVGGWNDNDATDAYIAGPIREIDSVGYASLPTLDPYGLALQNMEVACTARGVCFTYSISKTAWVPFTITPWESDLPSAISCDEDTRGLIYTDSDDDTTYICRSGGYGNLAASVTGTQLRTDPAAAYLGGLTELRPFSGITLTQNSGTPNYINIGYNLSSSVARVIDLQVADQNLYPSSMEYVTVAGGDAYHQVPAVVLLGTVETTLHMEFKMPDNTDITSSMTLKLFITNLDAGNTSGQMDFKVYWTAHDPASGNFDIDNGETERSVTASITSTLSQYETELVDFALTTDIAAGDLIFLTIRRLGSTDTETNDLGLVAAKIIYSATGAE